MWGRTFRTLTPTLLTLTHVPAGVSKPLLITNPSSIVASYHMDWWNNPGSALAVPAAYSEEETTAFHDWLKLADQVCVHYNHCT